MAALQLSFSPLASARSTRQSSGFTAFNGLSSSQKLNNNHRAAVKALTPLKRRVVVARAESSRESGGGFLTGFLFGGVVFGALGYIFAPQISKALLGSDDEEGGLTLLPSWIKEEDSLEVKRRKMNEKLAELNKAIDRTSAELKGVGYEDDEVGEKRRAKKMESIDAI